MFRGVAVILAVLMLMPSGICLCQAAPCCLAATGGENASSTTSGATCGCAARKLKEAGEAGSNSSSATPTSQCPPSEHAPNCPARSACTPNKVIVAHVTMTFSADLTAFRVPLTLVPVVAKWQSGPTIPVTHDPPLFVSHCAFLI